MKHKRIGRVNNASWGQPFERIVLPLAEKCWWWMM
jgi:hypothetical protein